MPALPYWLFPGDDRPTEEIDDEIAEELQLHLDLLAEEQERRGLAPEEAKQKAAERFGDFNQLLRRCRREKQGDVVMLKRVQAVLTGLLLASVIYMGWQQWTMATVIAQEQKDIKGGLLNVIDQLNRIAPIPVANVVPGSPQSAADNSSSTSPLVDGPSTYVANQYQSDRVPWPSVQEVGPTVSNRSYPEPTNSSRATELCIKLGEVWLPPYNPNLKKILDEARADAKAEKYDSALAKYLFFYQAAEKFDPSLSAVRLSFALSEWRELGKTYPPALELLQLIRDALNDRLHSDEGSQHDFRDFAAFNRALDEDNKTVEAFADLDRTSPKAAREAVHFARRALVAGKAYDLYAKYIDGKRDYLVAEHIYDLDLEREKNTDAKNGNGIKKLIAATAEQRFRNEAATLVALLAIADRKSEAEEIAVLAKEKLNSEQFHKVIDAALEGTIPAQ